MKNAFLKLSFFAVACSGALLINRNDGHQYTCNHRTAEFGVKEPYDVKGFVEIPEDMGLCSAPNNDTRQLLEGKIVFVERGNCTFYLKAVRAQEQGAVAIVIGNNATTDEVLKMIRVWPNATGEDLVKIPTVAISGRAYAEIVKWVRQNYTIEVTLDTVKLNRPGLTNLSVVILILVWMTIIGLYLCRKLIAQYIRQNRVTALRVVPTVPYQPLDDDDEERDGSNERARILNPRCVICMEDFEEGEQLRALPCRHGFHARCIDPWLSNHSDRCPICNQSMFMDPVDAKNPAQNNNDDNFPNADAPDAENDDVISPVGRENSAIRRSSLIPTSDSLEMKEQNGGAVVLDRI
mmetsp:Transcript_3248/g.6057  ORF Transcript_3248/g.6057 Transcript_3248/m.6057 type:complete len:350 (-) Transcript_3248:147-1196(-)